MKKCGAGRSRLTAYQDFQKFTRLDDTPSQFADCKVTNRLMVLIGLTGDLSTGLTAIPIQSVFRSRNSHSALPFF